MVVGTLFVDTSALLEQPKLFVADVDVLRTMTLKLPSHPVAVVL